MDNFDPYNVLLSIATNIPVLLMTAFVLQGHKYCILYVYIYIYIYIWVKDDTALNCCCCFSLENVLFNKIVFFLPPKINIIHFYHDLQKAATKISFSVTILSGIFTTRISL